MEDARSKDLLWHCHRVWQSRPGHSCQFWCWSTEPRPIVEQALVEDPLGSPPCAFLLHCTSGRATSSVTYIWSDVIYYLCYIFLQELLSIPTKMCVFTLLSPPRPATPLRPVLYKLQRVQVEIFHAFIQNIATYTTNPGTHFLGCWISSG